MEKNEKQFDKNKFKKTNKNIMLWTVAFGVLGVASIICAFTVNGGLTGLTYQPEQPKIPTNGPDPKDYYGKYYAFDEEQYVFLELELDSTKATYSQHFGDHDYKYSQSFEYDYFTEEYANYRIYSPTYSRDAIVVYPKGRDSNEIMKFWVFRENGHIHFQNEGYRPNAPQKTVDFKFSTTELSISSLNPPISYFANTYIMGNSSVVFNNDGTCRTYNNGEVNEYNYVLTRSSLIYAMRYSIIKEGTDLELVVYDKNTNLDSGLSFLFYFEVQKNGALYHNGSPSKAFSLVNGTDTYVNSVSLNIADDNEFTIGTVKQVTATLLPTNADYKTISWTSSHPEIATISSTGQLNCLADGKTTITACVKGGAYYTATIDVYDPANY